MSQSPTQAPQREHVHSHHDDGHGEGGAAHGTFGGYLIGFGLSVILTAIPFWLVMGHVIADKYVTTLVILGLAGVQMLVHLVFFLHMNTASEGGWNMLALIFTIVLLAIAVSGSFWIMYHLNVNMMPVSAHEMRERP